MEVDGMLPELFELMKIPENAPDEDIHGWLSAVADTNGWDYDSFISAFLPDCYVSPEDSYYSTWTRTISVHVDYYIRSYTKYYGIYSRFGFPSPQHMLMNHTSIPLCGLFAPPGEAGLLAEVVLNGSNAKIEPEHRPYLKWGEKDILARPPFRYCPSCAKEDMEAYGRVIAHVPHQGWGWDPYCKPVCYKHKVRLVKYEKLEPALKAKEPKRSTRRAGVVAEIVEYMYRVRAVGDADDLDTGYRQKFGQDVPEKGSKLDLAENFTPEELVYVYEKTSIRPALNTKAARAMKAHCKEAKLLGYSPFPFMKYRCGEYRGESISYILSLTSGMTCKLCGRCGD